MRTRFCNRIRTLLPALALFMAVTSAPPALATEPDGASVYKRLKGLVGAWQGTWNPGGLATTVTYSLTGNGSALVEDYRIGDVTMATVYHLDGEDLMLTHYCSHGNQPRMRMSRLSDDGNAVQFDFVDITNRTSGGYSKALRVTWLDDDRISLMYTGSRTGRSTGVDLERVR